ncbi:MAG: glycosyltransferase [Rubripirellula sp.]|nr:glycosyltransferase [Rubripirellula sp.]
MIKITFVVHSLQPGGIERSVTRIVNGLDRARFCPAIICLDGSGPAANWLTQEVPIIEIRKNAGNDLAAIRRMAHALQELGTHIVQSHNWGTLVETVFAKKFSRCPLHVHAERGTVLGLVESGGFRHWLRARAMSLSLSQVDQVVSNSRTVADRVHQRCGYPVEKIAIVPNGVAEITLHNRAEVRDEVRSMLGLEGQNVLLGSVGRLAEVKRFDLALAAFAAAYSDEETAHLVLVGDGPERDGLIRVASELGVLERVHFAGHQDDVSPWLAAMDIYFNSSRSEGMSQSLIEAMAAGLPIVATDVGDSAYVLGDAQFDKAGICVPANDTQALAEAFRRFSSDLSFRKRLGLQSMSRHQRFFSEEQLLANCQTLYTHLVGDSQTRKLRN